MINGAETIENKVCSVLIVRVRFFGRSSCRDYWSIQRICIRLVLFSKYPAISKVSIDTGFTFPPTFSLEEFIAAATLDLHMCYPKLVGLFEKFGRSISSVFNNAVKLSHTRHIYIYIYLSIFVGKEITVMIEMRISRKIFPDNLIRSSLFDFIFIHLIRHDFYSNYEIRLYRQSFRKKYFSFRILRSI